MDMFEMNIRIGARGVTTQ